MDGAALAVHRAIVGDDREHRPSYDTGLEFGGRVQSNHRAAVHD